MKTSRLRAPIRVLEEVLGEPDSDPGMDKSSTLFVHAFEGEEIAVFDFHKPEWGGQPECLTDSQYVWNVDGDSHDVARFCAWLRRGDEARPARHRPAVPMAHPGRPAADVPCAAEAAPGSKAAEGAWQEQSRRAASD